MPSMGQESLVAPVDRIKRALGPDKAAALDRVLVALADRVDEIVAARGSAAPEIRTRFHRGLLVELRLVRDEDFV